MVLVFLCQQDAIRVCMGVTIFYGNGNFMEK